MEIQQLLDTSLQVVKIPLSASDGTIICDTSSGNPRPYNPVQFHHAIFNASHNLSHPGIRVTQHLLTDHYVWPGINQDVRAWAQTCLQCQCCKVHSHTRQSLNTFATPYARFDHVPVDIVEPLPPSCGYAYILTCMDCFTRWPEAIPIPDISTESVATAFI